LTYAAVKPSRILGAIDAVFGYTLAGIISASFPKLEIAERIVVAGVAGGVLTAILVLLDGRRSNHRFPSRLYLNQPG